MKRYAWYSDTHLNLSVFPFLKRMFISRLKKSGVDGVMITGDVSSGSWLESDLGFLARHFDGPIYFVLGNHDYHNRHIESVHSDVRRLTAKYPNLFWMTENPLIALAEDVALIGTEGWYDATLGDPQLLRWTLDWMITFDFLHKKGIDQRIDMWRNMSSISSEIIAERLEHALQDHKTVYVMTHFPPWKEATRAVGTPFENFWLPYNTNFAMGQAIERVMSGRKKKRVIVLAGHTHTPCHIRVTNNIECIVARASYWGRVRPEQTIIV
jgi:predicted phosphohydrolase